MEIIAYRPPPGVWKGIDTAGDDDSVGNVITPEIARKLRAEGYRWVARYLRLDGTVPERPVPGGGYRGCYELSAIESRWILGAGLGIAPVQFAAFGSAADGNRWGRAMVTAARLLGWPRGLHLFADVEGSRVAAATPAEARAFIEAGAAAKIAGGHRGALYSTGELPLSSQQLYGLRGVTCYWAAAGPTRAAPLPRGDAIEQDPPTRVCGIRCDTDTMRPDRRGSCPTIVATPEIAASWHGEALGTLAGAIHLTTY